MAVRVVIAEDEWVVAEEIRLELVGLGYEVLAVARTGTEALDLCVQQRPDLMLMDLRMPDMDGLVATSRIMSSCPLCVIIITGYPELREQAERAGAVGYLTKPFTAGLLAETLQAARERFARLMGAQEGQEGDARPV